MLNSNYININILIITFIIIIKSITIVCNVCENVCKTSKNCLVLCEKGLKDQNRNPINLAHCGLTQLNDKTSDRIVNGNDAKDHAYPWMVSLHFSKPEEEIQGLENLQKMLHFCGGAIINEYFILTAAHCL